MSFRPGTRLGGRYEVVGTDAETSTHDVLHALDHDVEVEVTLWAIRPELLPDETRRRRFVAAAASLRKLSHPHLRKVFDAGVHDGVAFVAMQKLPGEPLSALVDSGARAGLDELRRIGALCADALVTAHAAGHLHGRLSSADIVMVSGEPKLGGVGLWAHVDPGALAAATRDEAHHLAPEVVKGRPVTASADVFGLALVLAELAVGSRTPAGAASAAMVDRLERLRPDVSMALGGGLYDSPGMRPRDPLSLVRRMGELDDLAVPTIEAQRPVDDDGPTTSYLAAPPAPVEIEMETVPLPKLDGVPVLPLAAPPTPTPKHQAGTSELPVEMTSRLPMRSATPTPMTVPGSRGEPRLANGSAPPRLGTPGPVPPRAPTHRQASRELPAVDPARFGGAVQALGRRRVPIAWIVALLALGAAAVILVPRLRSSRAPARQLAVVPAADAGVPVDAAAPDAPPAARPLSPCPPGMVLVQARPSFCIDAFEAPGEGKLPVTGVSLADARAACTAAGKRLCAGDEWERACRGQDRDSYPWGDRYQAGRCHLRAGDDAKPVPAGQFEACVSASGAHDMSGNVAEWSEDGEVRGGSASDGRDGRCSRSVRRKKPAADVGYRCCAGLVGAPPT